jgi:hypothetical protein
LLVGAWCAPALASNGLITSSDETPDSVPTAALEAASPRLIEKTDARLHESGVIDRVKTAEKSAEINVSSPKPIFGEYEELESETKKPVESPKLQGITTRLPGVPNASLPRVRREMYRTDI